MTGKESIKSIKNYIKNFACNYEKDYTPFEPEKFYLKTWIESIEKDLEVLEILKRIDWLVFQNGDRNNWDWHIDINKSMKITEEEAGKIRKWLYDK